MPLRLEELVAVAEGRLAIALDDDPAHRARLEAGARAVTDALESRRPLYGASTGVGASVVQEIPAALQAELPLNVLRLHGCGVGPILDETAAASVVAARAASLACGWSGVRPLVIERLCELVNLRVLPRIPALGSVGASGDLTPLSYVAALLVGEREASVGGREMPASEALAGVGLAPLALRPKESLSLMNGTSFMTGLGALAHGRAARFARLAAALTAATSDVVRGNPEHFDARIFAAKPHRGTVRCAAWIRADLVREGPEPEPLRLQDRYSIRCAPHVVGVLLDALDFARGLLEIELNGANDNPLVDPDSGEPLHGGNFYGGHVAFALDSLKTAVASVADLLDRQLVLLCDPATNGGLPENLVGASGPERVAHHGMKAMQITASALAAEAQKLTLPASAFSRSTESHNQDKVSMGAIAAREALRTLELAETIAAIGVLAVCQAVDLRGTEAVARGARALHAAVRKAVPMLRADRRQDEDVQRVLALLAAGELALPEDAEVAPTT
ncbi:MAG TPA: aromatic amino acid ammonia-lyase [Myxococcota bacterium]|jgi:histidine ammonia-lyase|nr:aromatic amino acid ammonia-lyase [Myxococcota bacterium]